MEERFQKIFNSLNRQVSSESFEKYILHSSQHIEDLFKTIRQCRTQNFPRFNIWRMLLEIMPINGNLQQKKSSIALSRKRWSDLKQEARTGIKPTIVKQVVLPKNPLMKVMAKTQKKDVQSDSFLNEEIKKDVDRTYQQLAFFQDPQILKLLTNVLFVWCKINSDISYRQGMNQLLASIVFVYFQEAVPSNYQPSSQLEQTFVSFNSATYAEADIFTVFEKIMQIQKDMYKQSLDGDIKGLVNPNSKNNSPILQRILQIQDQKLKSLDLELFRIIKLQDVKTKTFLLRWIRCLHTRQFGLVNSLYIWDSIFLDAYESPNSKNKHQYEFVDAMCIAMFIYLRSVVLTRQTSNQILQIYQKYPSLEGQFLYELIRLAWSVCEQLRFLANNPSNNSNWYQESDKIKKLGLMDKGGYSNTVKTEVQSKQKSKQLQIQSISKQVEQNINEGDIFSIKKTSSSKPEKAQTQNNGELFVSNKNKVDILNRKNPNIEQKEQNDGFFAKPKDNTIKKLDSPVKVQKNLNFQYDQLKKLVEMLKQSISINNDIQSRALANRALKLLESKLQN